MNRETHRVMIGVPAFKRMREQRLVRLNQKCQLRNKLGKLCGDALVAQTDPVQTMRHTAPFKSIMCLALSYSNQMIGIIDPRRSAICDDDNI